MKILYLGILASVCLAGCNQNPDIKRIWIYSFDPGMDGMGTGGNAANKKTFYGYEVLGSVKIKDPDDIATINAALTRAIDNGGEQAMCFEPRHGIRIERGGSKTDYVICFHCFNYSLYHDGEGTFPHHNAIDPKPLKILNDYLKDADIPLAK